MEKFLLKLYRCFVYLRERSGMVTASQQKFALFRHITSVKCPMLNHLATASGSTMVTRRRSAWIKSFVFSRLLGKGNRKPRHNAGAFRGERSTGIYRLAGRKERPR